MTPDPNDPRYCPEWLQREPDAWWDRRDRRRRNRLRLAIAATWLATIALGVAALVKIAH